jgi:hypothetical protein
MQRKHRSRKKENKIIKLKQSKHGRGNKPLNRVGRKVITARNCKALRSKIKVKMSE